MFSFVSERYVHYISVTNLGAIALSHSLLMATCLVLE